MGKLSVSHEHKEAFRISYLAANTYLLNNKRIYSRKFKLFKDEIEPLLLTLTVDKLTSLFGVVKVSKLPIQFDFFTHAKNGNSGGTEFLFDIEPELSFLVNFNILLRDAYKKNVREFCLLLADVYTHELLHCISYIKQHDSVSSSEELLKDSIFKGKEYLLEADSRYTTDGAYNEDLPYFSVYDELICYSKDAARQLLTEYKDKKVVLDKLSTTRGLIELAEKSDCFYFYYNCFYADPFILPQYRLLWHRFIKHLYYNLNEDFAV